MTNTEKLDEYIQRSGYKLSYIAKCMGISRYTLLRKRANQSEFRAHEINALCELLRIDSLEDRDAIFFAKNVE